MSNLNHILRCAAIYRCLRSEGVSRRGASDHGKRWALLVGIDTYDDPTISPLRYCTADVKAFHEALIGVSLGRFDSNQVYLMTNKATGRTRPTHTNVLFRLEKLVELVKPEDTFVFYFSGHGMTREGVPFLLSANADARTLSTLEVSAIPLQKVKQILSSIKAHQTLIILDACRNDPASGRGDEDNPLTEALARGVQVNPKLRASELPLVTATLYACSLGERAYEWPEKKHGVFSYFLLEGLKEGKSATSDGEVTVASLAEYTQQNVAQWAKNNPYDEKTQPPWLIQEGGAKLVLAQAQSQSAIVEIQTAATLSVTSQPKGAAVYFDGVRIGVIPLHDVEVDTSVQGEKQVKVSLELSGYKSKVAEMTLHGGRSSGWNVMLEQWPPSTPAPPREELTQPQVDIPIKPIISKDGAPMVRIPAGGFQMGSNKGRSKERPVHTVYVDAFYMDVYEVTNAQYKKFIEATGHRKSRYWDYPKFNQPNQPVVGVDWNDAVAYCKWVKKRLPTEAEWEYAARGDLAGKRYPWGDTIKESHANYDYTVKKPNPGGSYQPNAHGLYDMIGSVWEWCADWYDANYYKNSSRRNPPGPSSGTLRVKRGGSWVSRPLWLGCAFRDFNRSDTRENDNGFRCVGGP